LTTDLKKNIEDILELTPMQQGMLFHTLYNEGSDAYLEQFCLDLEGDINSEIFRKAWEHVISRHQALRSSYRWKGTPKPVQIVEKEVQVSWTNEDWSKVRADEFEEQFAQLRMTDRRNLFDMEKAPLTRFILIKSAPTRYRLLWTFHHILMDGWSYPVIIGEVLKSYKSIAGGEAPALGNPIPFKTYISWLNKQNKVIAETFWKKELSGFAAPSHIKGLVGGKETAESVGSQEGIKFFPEDFTVKLTEFARKNQVTLSTLMQAAWALVISAYSGERDVIYGGTVSGRPPDLPDVEKIVGLFINTLPVRVRLDAKENISTWLKSIQSKHIEREQYSYSSLADIQQWSELPVNTKLFDNILVFENYPSDPSLVDTSSLVKVLHISAFEKTNYPLAILVAPGKRLKLTVAYDENVYKDDFAEGILSALEGALNSMISDKSERVGDISLLTPEKEREIIENLNNTSCDLPKQNSVKEFFESLTAGYSSETALEFGKQSMSYRELNERANQLANYLVSLGVNEDSFVGISVERSFEMIISLLAIFKAGAAYLPLDKLYPAERIEYMISDSDVKFIITKRSDSGLLPPTDARIIYVDDEATEINKQSIESPAVMPAPESAAYMIYTSGSTGKPKGVIMHNAALVNLLNWQINGQKFDKGLITLQFTTLSFDVAFQEIFSTLLSGGKLIILSESERKDLSQVLNILSERKVQRLYLPFIALQEIAELHSSARDKQLYLKEVMTAGEQLQNTSAIRSMFKDLKTAFFTNQYGPTEAHVVTSYTLTGNPDEWLYNAPIGKPVFNTKIYILNSEMKPVPPGVSGELYIGGVQVARGYHNKKELTDEKFIKDIFAKNESDRIYKTGDIARYMSDGNIEFLGRADNQIKYRGYRIELGEIESVLNEFNKVSTSAVVIRDASNGEKRLAAYMVLKHGEECNASELKNKLSESLPDFMLPADYVFLKEMPLLPSGKVDLRSLPEPERNVSASASGYIEPNSELELQLVRIWEKVLGVKQIGITDNFFELGGHSLLALRLFGYIEKLTGKKLAISTLFSHPTIKQLAEILKTEGWKPPWKSLVAVKPGGSRLPFFCVPPGAGTALHFQSLVKYISQDQPFYVLESIGLDGKDEPHTNIEEMAAHYVKEIRMIQPDGPYLIGGRCFGGRVVFEMAQQFVKQGQEVALLAIFDTWPPFQATPNAYVPPKRNLKHFIKSIRTHAKSGDLKQVVDNYVGNKVGKLTWKIKNKTKYILSSEKSRLYNRIMLMHFAAQDRYVAKKYPGKITLIECSTFKADFRKGWQELAGGGFETHVVPDTDHKTIVREPKIRDFADKLNLVLDNAHAKITGNIINNSNSVAKTPQSETVEEQASGNS
jgi:amino acid adenylation domain-containing protein